jgi:hypothetical protein
VTTIAVAIIISAAFFGSVWWFVRRETIRVFGPNAAMTFTPNDGRGVVVPFEPRHERYMKIAEVVTTLASASLVFLPASRLGVYTHSCAFALVLLGSSVLFCVSFMAVLTYFYEGFLYFPNSYAPWKYGLVHALGFGGLFCFALAYMWLAVRVGWAVIYAGEIVSPSKALL